MHYFARKLDLVALIAVCANDLWWNSQDPAARILCAGQPWVDQPV